MKLFLDVNNAPRLEACAAVAASFSNLMKLPYELELHA